MSSLAEDLVEMARRYGGRVETPDDTVASAGLDSLEMESLLLEVEEMYGVRLDCRLYQVKTFREWASYLWELGAQPRLGSSHNMN